MSAVEFNEMLVSNSDFLKPYAITLTRDSEVAGDLFQETMYRAMANREKYNQGTNLKAWLYTIMRNIFINNYRRKMNRMVIIDTAPNEFLADQYFVESRSTESMVYEKEIMKAVHTLPDIFKKPFILYFDGFRYHEIAKILHEPLGTIKSRIHFARKTLKSEIERF
ncbi:MAG: RNA polymerase sigma factor [Chitinophagaceae bacterium]|nr:RNA polymerase sigma factor [Chitinophagaceae bacterium]